MSNTEEKEKPIEMDVDEEESDIEIEGEPCKSIYEVIKPLRDVVIGRWKLIHPLSSFVLWDANVYFVFIHFTWIDDVHTFESFYSKYTGIDQDGDDYVDNGSQDEDDDIPPTFETEEQKEETNKLALEEAKELEAARKERMELLAAEQKKLAEKVANQGAATLEDKFQYLVSQSDVFAHFLAGTSFPLRALSFSSSSCIVFNVIRFFLFNRICRSSCWQGQGR